MCRYVHLTMLTIDARCARPLEMKLQVVVNCLIWILVPKNWSSVRAVNALTCWATSPFDPQNLKQYYPVSL